MCGIYGSTKLYSDDIILQKLQRIKFRGPDFSDYKIINDSVILGHNRLAILDLDERSNQPFRYFNLTIVFNGEIYNYLDLKSVLIELGHKFRTTSDTEVVCAAYLEWGDDCVKKFNGMFSFVIYDENRNEFFGSRDRLGKKPFYYIHNGTWFEFSSQPSQLVIGNSVSINENAISQFLVWHHIPDPKSIYNEICKLPAGTSFKFNLINGNLNIIKYWDLGFDSDYNFNNSYPEAKEILNNLLTDATKIRMVADVPIGVFLSGGIDSSLIASLAQSSSVNKIDTFSIKFKDVLFDESIYAERIASYLDTNHTTITCDYNDGLSLIEDIGEYYDEPFGDNSSIPTLLLSKNTKKHVTVALSGDGGDEGFLGYERYDWMLLLESFYRLPLSIRKPISYFLKKIENKRLQSIGHVIELGNLPEVYKRINSTPNVSFLLNPELSNNFEHDEYLFDTNSSLLERISNYDIKTYLNNDINTKVDRASMAYSLECRAPLMDYRIIEFSRKIPSDFKYLKGNKKRILKDILNDYLPNELFERPKQGFGAPIKNWFRNELKEYVLDMLTQKNLKSIPNLNVKEVFKMIDNHMKNKIDSSSLIWDLLVFLEWEKRNKI